MNVQILSQTMGTNDTERIKKDQVEEMSGIKEVYIEYNPLNSKYFDTRKKK